MWRLDRVRRKFPSRRVSKNNDELREFLRKTLPSIPGVTVSRYALVPRILRNIDEWVSLREDFGLE